jgi:hypothetical protein
MPSPTSKPTYSRISKTTSESRSRLPGNRPTPSGRSDSTTLVLRGVAFAHCVAATVWSRRNCRVELSTASFGGMDSRVAICITVVLSVRTDRWLPGRYSSATSVCVGRPLGSATQRSTEIHFVSHLPSHRGHFSAAHRSGPPCGRRCGRSGRRPVWDRGTRYLSQIQPSQAQRFVPLPAPQRRTAVRALQKGGGGTASGTQRCPEARRRLRRRLTRERMLRARSQSW